MGAIKADNDLELKKNKDELVAPKGLGARHAQVFMMFIGMLIAYALRSNLSVAIVQMVDNTSNKDFEEYNWDESTQSIILSSFFWGYVAGMLPAGELTQRFGARYLILGSILLCSTLTLFTALAATGGYEYVLLLRVLQGICQSFVHPTSHNLLSKWAPIEERGVLCTFLYAGGPLGSVVMLATSGFIAEEIGWPSIFYISGGAGIIWSVVWFFYGASSPEEDSKISLEEKTYILNSLGNVSKEAESQKSPWKDILTSVPFWALILCHMGQNWGFWFLQTEMPTFMKNILELDIKKNALLSALPYLTMWILSFGFSYISDYLINRKILSTSFSRKLYNSIAHWIPAIVLLGLGYVTENTALSVTLLTITIGLNAGTYVGFMVNHMDLAPNFAGTLMAVTNFAANIMGILAPLSVGVFIDDFKDPAQWRVMFFITSAIYIIGNLFFVVFGKSDVQKWNDKTVR